MKLKLISCEILYREICAAVASSPNLVDVEFLTKGLHDIGSAKMREHLQSAIDKVDCDYAAVLLGYGLCGNGTVGLKARSVPVVIPRAHDCITFFLGGKERYLDYFQSHPGVYFKTTGWIERGENLVQLVGEPSVHDQLGRVGYEQLVERYGEDNAAYLWEQLGDFTRYYQRLTFIETGLEPDYSFETRAREEAVRRGWEFEKVQGDLSLIKRFVDGLWDERDFLVLPPGATLEARYDDSIMAAEPECKSMSRGGEIDGAMSKPPERAG